MAASTWLRTVEAPSLQREFGAMPCVADVFDRDTLLAALRAVHPDAQI